MMRNDHHTRRCRMVERHIAVDQREVVGQVQQTTTYMAVRRYHTAEAYHRMAANTDDGAILWQLFNEACDSVAQIILAADGTHHSLSERMPCREGARFIIFLTISMEKADAVDLLEQAMRRFVTCHVTLQWLKTVMPEAAGEAAEQMEETADVLRQLVSHLREGRRCRKRLAPSL